MMIGPGEVGVSVKQAATLPLEREEGQHARSGLAAKRHEVAFEARGIAAKTGSYGRRERSLRPWGTSRRASHLGTYVQYIRPIGAVGVVRRNRFLEQHVEAGE